MKRKQTTYTFSSQHGAEIFRVWLKRNENDRDYGYPKFVDLRQVNNQPAEWCVEYGYENDFARGVATGIDITTQNPNDDDYAAVKLSRRAFIDFVSEFGFVLAAKNSMPASIELAITRAGYLTAEDDGSGILACQEGEVMDYANGNYNLLKR